MDPFKELIFGADRTRAINVYLSEHLQEYEQLATLFPYGGLQRVQLRVKSSHDTGEIVGVEILIGLGRMEEQK
jgi:hypothetical protein